MVANPFLSDMIPKDFKKAQQELKAKKKAVKARKLRKKRNNHKKRNR
ncbi:gp51 [Sphingomonas phage PAU]|nr:gp51 [Sphingomonas phage PAU]AFF28049.1 gp51 [Sphingomonas phage PAU]